MSRVTPHDLPARLEQDARLHGVENRCLNDGFAIIDRTSHRGPVQTNHDARVGHNAKALLSGGTPPVSSNFQCCCAAAGFE